MYVIGIPASAGLDVYVRRWATGFLYRQKLQLYIGDTTKTVKVGGTHCVVTLFKAKVIWRVNVEYQFARFQNTVCNFVEKWKMTILFLTYRFKIVTFYIRSFRIIP